MPFEHTHLPVKLRHAIEQGFIWATGIEDTFIAEPHPRTGRVLDEYLLTEHYQRWEEDLQLIADLGVKTARYGIPWHKVNPAPNSYDWSWTDAVLERLVTRHGIEPIVDLIHYGTPLWMDGSFTNPDFPLFARDYAHQFAERYRALCSWYTPLNEPRINAWYCGRLRRWPPFRSGWSGFVQVLLQLSRAIVLIAGMLKETLPEPVLVHVDASDLYVPHDPTDQALAEEARFRSQLVYLALDLVMGRVDGHHPLYAWLTDQEAGEPALEWLREHKTTPHVIGFNMYPMYSHKEVLHGKDGRIEIKIRSCGVETLLAISKGYASHFPGYPLMVTETASSGSVGRRRAWIQDSTKALLEARANGLPLIGYTLWPLFSLVTWAYQVGKKDLERYLLHMGLYDLIPGPGGLSRKPTEAAEAYRTLVQNIW